MNYICICQWVGCMSREYYITCNTRERIIISMNEQGSTGGWTESLLKVYLKNSLERFLFLSQGSVTLRRTMSYLSSTYLNILIVK